MKIQSLMMAAGCVIASSAFISTAQAQQDNMEVYLSLNKGISSLHKEADVFKAPSKPVKTNNKIDLEMVMALLANPDDVQDDKNAVVKKLEVVATAYTSHIAQTDSTPTIAAWGDKLRPSTKAIAVSRDLLTEYGLKHRTKVRIKGLSGEFLVLDKMNKRWRKKIDIYMGMNKKAAYRWGARKVVMTWRESV